MKSYCRAGAITAVKKFDPNVISLDGVLTSYHGLPQSQERAAAKCMSHAGGQGFKRCNCRGTCSNKQCSCFKAGRNCTPRCHKGNHNYQNLLGSFLDLFVSNLFID